MELGRHSLENLVLLSPLLPTIRISQILAHVAHSIDANRNVSHLHLIWPPQVPRRGLDGGSRAVVCRTPQRFLWNVFQPLLGVWKPLYAKAPYLCNARIGNCRADTGLVQTHSSGCASSSRGLSPVPGPVYESQFFPLDHDFEIVGWMSFCIQPAADTEDKELTDTDDQDARDKAV